MKKLLVLVVFCYGSLALDEDSSEHGVTPTKTTPNCTCGFANKDNERIVNGTGTKPSEYPMVAALVVIHKMKVNCGGTIITKKHIITAAHCTMGVRPGLIGIHVGSNSYERVKWNHDLYKVKKFINHPQYYRLTVVYDISIILIEGEFPFETNKNIGPACLPTKKIDLVGEKVKVLGWGRLASGGDKPIDLMQVYLDVKAHEFCHKDNPTIEVNDRHQFCTFTRGKDSCQGDSGGPLLWLNPVSNMYTLVGAVSYGKDCGVYPGVNTEISYFLPWIQSVIANTTTGIQTCGVV